MIFSVVVGATTILSLRMLGLVVPISIQSDSMAPSLIAGDIVITEAFTLLVRTPHRGDIVAFKTDGISLLPPGRIYIKRIVGEPGDWLRMADGQLYVNDTNTSPIDENRERHGSIESEDFSPVIGKDSVVVPDRKYFVVGDNLANSSDSRSWGFVPVENVLRIATFRYWPIGRFGRIK